MRAIVNLASAGLISLLLGACLVAGPSYVVYDAPAKTGKAAPAGKGNLADQVRARLRSECMSEHGGFMSADSKLGTQCDCFAGTVTKSMRKDDQEFYTNYGVVPTLSGTRPDEVKKQCGIAGIGSTGPRP